MTERGAATAHPAAEDATEIISALRQAASPEQTAALVAALYVARSRTADSIATSAYQNYETVDVDQNGRTERRLRAA